MVFLTDGNMRRQFFRVKQLADQTFARAEKTEVLNDDLANKEKRIEVLRQVCLNTSKRLQACIQGQGTDGASLEKRGKKLPQFLLGCSMEDCGNMLGKDSMLAETLLQCGKSNIASARNVLQYEVEVEKLVLEKFLDILENDIPNITKLRKNLSKLTLDYDSAKTRYQAASRHSAQAPNANTKIDGLREECEDALLKMEQCRDALALEFYTLLTKETDLSQSVYQLLKSQADFHRRSLNELEAFLPKVEKIIENHSSKPVYGIFLDEHLRVTGRKVALPIEACVCWLLECGIEEEGLFRIAGSATKVKKLKSSFDVGVVDMKDYDPHTVAGALKQYLRELPEPLMTFTLYEKWIETANHADKDERLKAMFEVLAELPNANYINLRYLIKFLAKLAAQQDVNKMSTQNIAIVIAPNLMWSKDGDQGMNMGSANMHSILVDSLISHSEYFFPEEEEFFLGLLTKSHFEGMEMMSSMQDDLSGEEEVISPLGHLSEPTTETFGCSSSKSSSTNGSPKAGGSPKSSRRPKKPPAPRVPPPIRERLPTTNVPAPESADDPVGKAHFVFAKPTVPFKPRHERKASEVSIDLNHPGPPFATDGVASAQVETRELSASSSVAKTAVGTENRPSSTTDEWCKVTPKALKVEDTTTQNLEVEKAQVKILSIEKSKPTYVRVLASPDEKPAIGPLDESYSELTVPPSPRAQRKSLENLDRAKVPDTGKGDEKAVVSQVEKPQPQQRIIVVGPAPERPPKPQGLGHPPAVHQPSPGLLQQSGSVSASCSDLSPPKKCDSAVGKEKSGGTALSILRAFGLHSGPEDAVSKPLGGPKPLRHSTQSLDRDGKLKQPLMSAPSQDTAVHDRPQSPSDCGTVTSPSPTDEEHGGPAPPERPEKFDKSKVVPPARPEKSDRLRALLESPSHKNVPPPPLQPTAVAYHNLEDKVPSKPAKVKGPDPAKEKPARPPYSPSAPARSERSHHADGGRTIYPNLSELDDLPSLGHEGQPSSPRSHVSAVVPSSPGAPKRPPRPQPRPPPVPVAKPRSLVAAPEQTHL